MVEASAYLNLGVIPSPKNGTMNQSLSIELVIPTLGRLFFRLTKGLI